ncbi:MAG TPA: protein phosphatase 2C domain-containing protein [Micromonosporaceae bacterium]|nr:protein phosphatase 2C domain-containing protein [Micromonosporaceae bacterium]
MTAPQTDIRTTAVRWRVAAADATGAHHVARQMRYEDAWAVTPATVLERDEPSVVVAVADGHGHARHFRSAEGAEIAVAVAARLGAGSTAEIAAASDAATVEEILGRLAPAVVSVWREHVRRDIEERPVTDDERVAAGLEADATFVELLYGYGATLLVAIAAGAWLACLQLGDGDLFVVAPDGTVRRPVPSDPRLDGLRTTSLCQPDAVDSIRYGVVKATAQPIGAVLLATDGFGNAQRSRDWDGAFGADLATLIQRHGDGWVARALPEWVRDCASSDGSGDDVTAVLLFAADTPWLAATEPRWEEPPAPTTEPPADTRPLIPTQRSRPASHRQVPAARSTNRLRLPLRLRGNRLIALSALVILVLAAGIGIWLGVS